MIHANLGKLVVTMPVHNAMLHDPKFSCFVQLCLGRFMHNDRGERSEEDKAACNVAVDTGKDRISAAYKFPKKNSFDILRDDRILIVTEYESNLTTVMFPSEH